MNFKCFFIDDISICKISKSEQGLEIDCHMDEEMHKDAFFGIWENIDGGGHEVISKWLKEEGYTLLKDENNA